MNWQSDLNNLDTVVREVIAQLQSPFVIGLTGAMGSGKSSFVRASLYHLGLDPETPVPSPSFTYINEYQIADALYAHIDLDRLGPATAHFLGELGFAPGSPIPYRGIFIEWPQYWPKTAPLLQHRYSLQIEANADDTQRLYKLLPDSTLGSAS